MTGALARHRGALITLSVALAVIVVDQISKSAIVAALGPEGSHREIWIVPRLLRFFYVENTGAAFGFFQGNSSTLTILALGIVVVLAIAFRKLIGHSPWLAVALGLQFGGALGNVIDRLHYGFVVDFIDLPRFPTFNVADSAITVGVVILGVFLVFMDQSSAPSEPTETPPPSVSSLPSDDARVPPSRSAR